MDKRMRKRVLLESLLKFSYLCKVAFFFFFSFFFVFGKKTKKKQKLMVGSFGRLT